MTRQEAHVGYGVIINNIASHVIAQGLIPRIFLYTKALSHPLVSEISNQRKYVILDPLPFPISRGLMWLGPSCFTL